MKKSRYTLWGPQEINGIRRWGVNEHREYGIYSAGPHSGFDTRLEAVEYLIALRQAERDWENALEAQLKRRSP